MIQLHKSKSLLIVLGLGMTASLAHAAIVTVDTEATIRGGTNSTTDQNEGSAGYIFVKSDGSTAGNNTRKAYFQFDLAGQNADLSAAATFTVTTNSFFGDHTIQLWALDQEYAGFTSTVTWDTAQANNTGNDDLLTSGSFTATEIGPAVAVVYPGSGGQDITFNLSSLTNYVFNDKITFALTGVDVPGNDDAGMRLALNSAELEFTVVPEPSALALIGLAGLGLMLRRRC